MENPFKTWKDEEQGFGSMGELKDGTKVDHRGEFDKVVKVCAAGRVIQMGVPLELAKEFGRFLVKCEGLRDKYGERNYALGYIVLNDDRKYKPRDFEKAWDAFQAERKGE